MRTALLAHATSREIAADLALLACLSFAWLMPLWGNRFFGGIESIGARLADRRGLAVVAIAAATIVIRLSLLWLLPIPVPKIQDEFSYLLAGDTFAHGRLTNPTHPMWMFFDTIHVNQHPTYMSKYPPAQGAVLALGQLLGHPWIGVLLSAAAMCAAVLWMLQGWLPPPWALLGATLVLLRLGIFSYWINSYWGGAVAAIGGALVMGAMPRIIHFQRARDAVLLGIGVAILVNSRPLEGLILCVPVIVVLGARLWGTKWRLPEKLPEKGRPRGTSVRRIVIPFSAVLLLTGIFAGYYNWRLTGNPLLLPYVLNDRTYYTSPTFVWQKAGPELHYGNPQLEAFYNGWVRPYTAANRMDGFRHALRHLTTVGGKFIYFFMWTELCVPLFAVAWVWRDRRVRFLVIQAALCGVGFLAVLWFEPHSAAPVIATVFALLTQGMRHLRKWQYRGRPVGIGWSRVVVLFALFLAPWHQRGGTFEAPNKVIPRIEYRARLAAELNSLPGKYLVIVRNAPRAGNIEEWVYNAADIDHAKLVWAREIPGVDMRPLVHYFQGRQIWLAEPDAPGMPVWHACPANSQP